jgi:hypothetical protein
MASAATPGKQQALIQVGPFGSLNASSAPNSVAPGGAVAASNTSTEITTGGLQLAPGRRTLITFGTPITGIASFDPTGATRQVAWSSPTHVPPVNLFNPDTSSGSPVTNGLPFLQAVQFGNRLFTDQGQQILNGVAYEWQQLPVIRTYGFVNSELASFATGSFLLSGAPATGQNNTYVINGTSIVAPQTTGNTLNQQATADALVIAGVFPSLLAHAVASTVVIQAPTRGVAGNAVTTTASSSGGDTVVANQATLSGGSNGPFTPDETLAYAFTRVTTFPDGTQQESTPDGALVVGSPLAYPYTYFVLGDGDGPIITPSSDWSGTNADGSTFFTYAYRWSTLQPIFYWLAKLTGSAPYTDILSEASLLPNVQLNLNQDPPPFDTGLPIGIFSHKNCMMVMAAQLTQNLDLTQGVDYSLWQSQLWFSDYGTPYSFNSVDQVLLVGQEGMSQTPIQNGFGDIPLGGLSFSSLAALLKSRSTWVLYGDDATTFLVRKVADIGCQSIASAAACEGVGIWLTERGVYSFNGGTMEYIGEAVRKIIDGISQADRRASVGWYGNHTYYLSFPATGITLRYYTPSQKWLPTLPYAATCGFAVPSEPQPAAISTTKFDYIITGDASGVIDLWNADIADRGFAITGTWQSPQTDSGAPWAQKVYRYVTVLCPVGMMGVISVSVVADGITIFDEEFDLSQGPAVTKPIPGDSVTGARGFTGYVLISMNANSTINPEVDAVIVSGTMDREYVIPDSYAGA